MAAPKNVVLVLVVAVVIAACSGKPIAEKEINNKEFKLEHLFDYQDCAAYRFRDGGNPIYFVRCGKNIQTSWYQSDDDTSVLRQTFIESQ